MELSNGLSYRYISYKGFPFGFYNSNLHVFVELFAVWLYPILIAFVVDGFCFLSFQMIVSCKAIIGSSISKWKLNVL